LALTIFGDCSILSVLKYHNRLSEGNSVMILKKLHHVGIVLPAQETADAFIEKYKLKVIRKGETPYSAKFIFAKAKGGSQIEFIIPSGEPLKSFNGGKGGIHHLCFKVRNIEAAENYLRSVGFELLEEKAKRANRHAKINFVRPSSSFGILVELIQINIIPKKANK